MRAERQTAGRGRQGRGWVSPPGNLYASTLVRLRPGDPPAQTLALVAGLALHDAVGIGTLKWPNDLLVDGAKLAGILLERAGEAVVIGFGVNVAHPPALDRPTTSLADRGIGLDAAALLVRLSETVAARLADWRGHGAAGIADDWLAAAHPRGTELTVHLPDAARLTGRFEGLGVDGALRLRLASGEVRAIHAGDVFQL